MTILRTAAAIGRRHRTARTNRDQTVRDRRDAEVIKIFLMTGVWPVLWP